VQLDVVRDHEPARIDADEPAAEHVVTEQHLSLASLEMREVEILSGELDAAGFISAIRSRGMKRRRPAMRRPGRSRRIAASANRAMTSSTRPSRPQLDRRGAVDDPGECQPDRFGGWLPGV